MKKYIYLSEGIYNEKNPANGAIVLQYDSEEKTLSVVDRINKDEVSVGATQSNIEEALTNYISKQDLEETKADFIEQIKGFFKIQGTCTMEELATKDKVEGHWWQVGDKEYVYNGTDWVEVGFEVNLEESDPKFTAVSGQFALSENIPTKVSQLENDVEYLTEHQDITGKANINDVYTKEQADNKFLTEHQSLDNYATKEEIPTKVSELENDSNFISSFTEEDPIYAAQSGQFALKSEIPSIPTKVSELENDEGFLKEHQDITGKADLSGVYSKAEADDKFLTEHQSLSGYATKAEIADLISEELDPKFGEVSRQFALSENVPTKISQLENDSNFISSYTETDPVFTAQSGQFALKEEIPTIPTNISVFTNDAGYLTEHQDITGKANVNDVYTKEQADEKFLTEHQSLDNYATKEELNELDYTSFEVTVISSSIAADTFSDIANPYISGQTIPYTYAITGSTYLSMIEKFQLVSNSPKESADVIIDWGDGEQTVIAIDENVTSSYSSSSNYYKFGLSHKYEAVGKYIVKIYGKDYFGIRNTGNKNNLISRVFEEDLSLASCVTDLTNFCSNALLLLKIKAARWINLKNIANIHEIFSGCSNLYYAIGFYGFIPKMLRYNLMFSNCTGLVYTDIKIMPGTFSIVSMFNSCAKLGILGGNQSVYLDELFWDTGYLNNHCAIGGAFDCCYCLKIKNINRVKELLWNNVHTYFDFGSTGVPFSFPSPNESVSLLDKIPTSWGGRSNEEPITLNNLYVSNINNNNETNINYLITNLSKVIKEVDALKLGALKNNINISTNTYNPQLLSSETNSFNFNDNSIDAIIEDSEVTGKASFAAKSVEIYNSDFNIPFASYTNNVAIFVDSQENVSISNTNINTNYSSSSNAIEMHNAEVFRLEDVTFSGNTYNTIMTGQRTSVNPKYIDIINCNFNENASHVNIWIGGWQDGAVANIKNCSFIGAMQTIILGDGGAISGQKANSLILNISNCNITSTETDPNYYGFIGMQTLHVDPADRYFTIEDARIFNPFKNVIININNVTVNGIKITKENFKMGKTGNNQQLWIYLPTWNNNVKFAEFPEFFPTVYVDGELITQLA